MDAIKIEGIGLTIPVRATLQGTFAQPQTGRQFLIREIANSLSHGAPAESSSAGAYLNRQSENLTSELMPILRNAIGADERRWATVLVNLMGIRRPTLKDLRAGGWRDANWNPSVDHGYSLASAILKERPANVRSDRMIVDALIQRMQFAPEHTLPLAGEYAINDYFVSSLEAALNRQQPGAVCVASRLIDDGHSYFLPYAQTAARKIAANAVTKSPTAIELLDREAAAPLLRR